MPWTKEEAAEYHRAYRQTPRGKKRGRIGKWRQRGIISADWDATHEYFMSTTHCEKCSVLLTIDKRITRTTKCLDHDHTIKDRVNIRAVLCHACNMNDRCDNTSGVPNINYMKVRDLWKYEKKVNGVRHQKYFKTKEDAIRYKYEYESRQSIIAEDARS